MIDKNETLAKASKDLLLGQPFYGLFLIQMNKKWVDDFPTLGVAKNGIGYQLILGTDFWNAQTPLHQKGLI